VILSSLFEAMKKARASKRNKKNSLNKQFMLSAAKVVAQKIAERKPVIMAGLHGGVLPVS
jgi:hypothetical protein